MHQTLLGTFLLRLPGSKGHDPCPSVGFRLPFATLSDSEPALSIVLISYNVPQRRDSNPQLSFQTQESWPPLGEEPIV
jgi:hypothetical protein